MTTSPAQADYGRDADTGSSSGSVSSGGDGSVQIAVSAQYVSAATDGSGADSVAVSSQTVTVAVLPVCWHTEGMTGKELAEWIDSGEMQRSLVNEYGMRLDNNEAKEQIARYPDYKSHADDTEGHWYFPVCSSGRVPNNDLKAFSTISDDFFANNGPVYVPAGQAAPEPVVDGATLARAAWDAVTIPTATIGYNPTVGQARATVVGMDTWIWATGDTPKEVRVTATAGPVSATVTATASRLTLQPKDGTATCTGFGIPWTQDNDSKGTDCVIVFDRSSAHFKDAVTPVDVKVSYAITYTATDGATGTMDTHTTSTTTTIPVAEIQAINTRPTKEP